MHLHHLTTLLFTLATTTVHALSPIGTYNPLDSQTSMDICAIPRTATASYSAAYVQSAGSCPPGNWNVGTVACCGTKQAAKTLGKGAACCDCGTTCTGFFPAMETGWEGVVARRRECKLT